MSPHTPQLNATTKRSAGAATLFLGSLLIRLCTWGLCCWVSYLCSPYDESFGLIISVGDWVSLDASNFLSKLIEHGLDVGASFG